MTQQATQLETPRPLKPTGIATILFGTVSLIGALFLLIVALRGQFFYNFSWILGLPVLLVGITGAIASARSPRTPVAIACVLQGLGALPQLMAFFCIRVFYLGGALGIALGIACALTVLAGAVAVIVLGARARSATRAATASVPPAPAGYTADGRPFYPIVGYTPDGTPITADQAPGYRPPAAGTNAMAITAFVMAFVFAILAIPFGHMARSQIRKTGESGGGLALAALIIGYLNLVILIGAGIAVAVIFALNS